MDFHRYQASCCVLPDLGFVLETGRMAIAEEFLAEKTPLISKAFEQMKALEAGAIANPDEKRQVGHYWLRAPELAPDANTRHAIEETLSRIMAFTRKVHDEKKFKNLLVIGIGGSALGPQFIAHSLGLGKDNKLTPYFFDNTDPEGFDNLLSTLELKKTLVIVISKSGSTPETRNGMIEAQAAFRRQKIPFAPNAVAITQDGSQLDILAVREKWLERFPMWDWVGGRTSVCSAVGLLPMALQGIDIVKFLSGAAQMDKATRSWTLENTNSINPQNTKDESSRSTEMSRAVTHNPAALMALCWLNATGGVGAKAMVVLPYKDRLSLFSKYLQQLVMESLGKALDLDGKRVHQGLTVYGNKGSTDQHAYVQQLRDGLNNFFATFIEVQKERPSDYFEVEEGITSGDYLQGFCLGTAVALEENFRQSMTIVLREVSPETVGALVALFERAVGFYATLVNINAYHQPGVEAGKKAAAAILTLKKEIIETLKKSKSGLTAAELAQEIASPSKASLIWRMLDRMSVNAGYRIKMIDDHNPFERKYIYEA